jgi:hypothetical protein
MYYYILYLSSSVTISCLFFLIQLLHPAFFSPVQLFYPVLSLLIDYCILSYLSCYLKKVQILQQCCLKRKILDLEFRLTL